MAPPPSDHDLHGGFDPEKHRREIEMMEQRFRERAAELEEGGDADERVSDEMREFFGASAERLEEIVPQLQDHGTSPDLVETTGEIRRSVDSFFDTAEAHDVLPIDEEPEPEPEPDPVGEAAPGPQAAAEGGGGGKSKMDLKTALERLRRGVPMAEASPPTPPPGPTPFTPPRPPVPAAESPESPEAPGGEPGDDLRPPGIPPQAPLKAPSTNQLPRVASVQSIETDDKEAPLSQKIDPGLVDKVRQGMSMEEIEQRMKSQGPGFQAEAGTLRPSDAGVHGARRSDPSPDEALEGPSPTAAASTFDEVFDELEELVKGSLGDQTQAYLHNLQNPQNTMDLPVPPPLEDSYSFTEEQAEWFQQERDKLNRESDPDLGKEEEKAGAKGYLAEKLEGEVKAFRPAVEALGRVGSVPNEYLQTGPHPDDDPKETVGRMTPVQIMDEIRMIRRLKAALIKRGVIAIEDMEEDDD